MTLYHVTKRVQKGGSHPISEILHIENWIVCFDLYGSVVSPIKTGILKHFVNWLSRIIKNPVVMSLPLRGIYFHSLNSWLFSLVFSCHF